MKFLPYKTFCSNFQNARFKLDENGNIKSLWIDIRRIFTDERTIKGIRRVKMRFDMCYQSRHSHFGTINVYSIEKAHCIEDKSDESYGEMFKKTYKDYKNVWLDDEYIKNNFKEYV